MRRRRFFQSLALMPALPMVPAAAQQYGGSTEAAPKLTETPPDAVASSVRRLFTEEQFATLDRLADAIVPHIGETPGARDAGAAAFLDFLIHESGTERQTLYRAGLDRLQADARKRYQRSFADIEGSQLPPLLEPLTRPWTYAPPPDPFARFLREVKEDLLQATVNSRQYAEALSQRSRSAAGINAYWLPLD